MKTNYLFDEKLIIFTEHIGQFADFIWKIGFIILPLLHDILKQIIKFGHHVGGLESVSSGTSYFGGLAITGGTVSGGTSVSLSSYSGGNGMGGNPGGGGPGGWH